MSGTAADLIVACLEAEGVDRAFCVPGESYLATLDAFARRNRIDLVQTRHESGAGFMAVADAKLTGQPGVALVSRGPGATNASIALHTAEQDAVPMVLFIGQVSRDEIGRGAFQEIDYSKMFGEMAKAVWTIMDADRIPEIVARAFQIARSGTPGPVVIVLPEDMQFDMTEAKPLDPMPVARHGAPESAVADIAARIAAAERPLIIAGGLLDNAKGRAALLAAAEALRIPAAMSFKHQDMFPNDNPLFAGHLGFNIPKPQVELLSDADLILAVGTRLGDTTTQGYVFPSIPPKQPLIHVHPDANVIGRVFAAETGLVADPALFLEALASAGGGAAKGREAWIARIKGYIDGLMGGEPEPADDGINFGLIVEALKPHLTDDAILITDAGNFSSWIHRHVRLNGRQAMVGAVSGAMGMGTPAAVAAGLRCPDRQVITFLGDGGAMMTGNELATAMARGVKAKVFVSNNASYGTIRLHQEKFFPGTISATGLANPDFAQYGAAFGAKGVTITKDDDIEAKVAEAMAHDGPVVVDVHSSLERISAYVSMGDLKG
ncbi:MAG: thiamine pyrophosphate-dependent enzyme [Minwuia sp.]|uniref:thiamine pyrophosphate-dependent enzyme n=1 Tax=Minwuia sp. TaxID=2493630 RepID=UPI003A88D331